MINVQQDMKNKKEICVYEKIWRTRQLNNMVQNQLEISRKVVTYLNGLIKAEL